MVIIILHTTTNTVEILKKRKSKINVLILFDCKKVSKLTNIPVKRASFGLFFV